MHRRRRHRHRDHRWGDATDPDKPITWRGALTTLAVIAGLGMVIGYFHEKLALYIIGAFIIGHILLWPMVVILGSGLLIGGLMEWVKRGRGPSSEVYKVFCLSCAGLLLLPLSVFGTMGSINSWETRCVHAYTKRTVPVLEEIRKKEGQYPSALPTETLGRPPKYMGDPSQCYQSIGEAYYLSYRTTETLFGESYFYTSETGRWELNNDSD